MTEAKSDLAYVSGLDVGQAQDSTALAVLEQSRAADPASPGWDANQYAVRHLERFPPGTPYTAVGARLAELFAVPPLARPPLAVDQTGVGRPVVDLIRRSATRAGVRPVTVTAGHAAGPDERGGWLVPKKELVSTLQVLWQARRLKVSPSLPEAQTLVRELTAFQVKVTASANDLLVAWREGPHDDLVLAVAVAAWLGERQGRLGAFLPFLVPSGPAWPWRR